MKLKNKVKFRIREMHEDDVPAVLSLVKGLAEFEKLSHEITATEELYKKNGFGESSYFRAVLAEEGTDRESTLLGFALYFFTFSTFTGKPTLYLEDLFVLPDYRGFGIGKSLLRKLAKIALDKGCGRMEWAVLNWNTRAIQFYKNINAIPLEDWTIFRLTETAINELVNK